VSANVNIRISPSQDVRYVCDFADGRSRTRDTFNRTRRVPYNVKGVLHIEHNVGVRAPLLDYRVIYKYFTDKIGTNWYYPFAVVGKNGRNRDRYAFVYYAIRRTYVVERVRFGNLFTFRTITTTGRLGKRH